MEEGAQRGDKDCQAEKDMRTDAKGDFLGNTQRYVSLSIRQKIREGEREGDGITGEKERLSPI
jgi:hypothetical protein